MRVYTCHIDVPVSLEQQVYPQKRWLLAFLCEADNYLNSTVYAGLPVCDLGFNFLFDVDFQLVTNRENVLFNTFIRNHLSVLFIER